MTFKVGQIVKLIDNAGMAAPIGAIAVVTELCDGYIKVKWIKGHTKKSIFGFTCQKDGGYLLESFATALAEGEQMLFEFMNEADHEV